MNVINALPVCAVQPLVVSGTLVFTTEYYFKIRSPEFRCSEKVASVIGALPDGYLLIRKGNGICEGNRQKLEAVREWHPSVPNFKEMVWTFIAAPYVFPEQLAWLGKPDWIKLDPSVYALRDAFQTGTVCLESEARQILELYLTRCLRE
jgi:hypothetical protein